ncbi:MAG: hypothetical protein Q4C91_08740 [Eubacteriales bacterium]|nr:hypothetical protein [Eubacteriales bacterium]
MMIEMKEKKVTTKRGMKFLTTAALTAVLLGGQVYPAMAGGSSVIEASCLLPENITIESPVALSEIALPESEYGTLTWADGSYVPSRRVETCEVIFHPADSVDPAEISGLESVEGTDGLRGYITVVVSSLGDEPEGGDSQAPSETPEVSEAPAEGEGSEVTTTPGITEGAEATTTPGVTAVPDVSVTPEGTPVPDSETEDTDTAAADESQGTEAAEQIGGESAETEEPPKAEENIFDQPDAAAAEDARPMGAEEDLTEEEQLSRAASNHTCGGISVSGINLPWYVQFRVTSGEEYTFTNESDANIFKSYEFELWDLQNNTEYEIPDGEYISVIVPVKEGYEYTIEHLLDNGAVETIIPSVEGSTMIFSTHSFSPFGIAGSKPLVGEELAEDGYGGNDSQNGSSGDNGNDSQNGNSNTDANGVQSQTGVSTTPGVVSKDNTDGANTDAGSKDNTNGQNDSQTDGTNSTSDSGTTTGRSVNTGDTTNILPFVVLVAVAAVVIGGVSVFLKKRK